MKNLTLSILVMFTLVVNAAATSLEPTNQKVLKTFTEVFKDVDNVSWTNNGDEFEAYFVTDNVKTRAKLDAKGNLIQTVRYYKEDKLPSNILYTLKKEFAGKEIVGVTEVTNKNGINYRIILSDDKFYTHINANDAGDTEVASKYKRGDK